MSAKARFVAVEEFQAHCASLLDEIEKTGEALILTREGKPVVRVVPFERPQPLLGSVLWEGDIVSPVEEA